MTTIFTDDFCYRETEITLDDPQIGSKGRDLIFASTEDKEVRITLTDDQLSELADTLFLSGFEVTP